MGALNALLAQEEATNGNSLLTFDGTDDSYIAGYVISSDQSGNYFEEIIFQDQASFHCVLVAGRPFAQGKY